MLRDIKNWRIKIADILKRGKLPIVCGGTGLYIKAIIENPMYPDIPPDWKLRKKLESYLLKNFFNTEKTGPKTSKNNRQEKSAPANPRD